MDSTKNTKMSSLMDEAEDEPGFDEAPLDDEEDEDED